MLLNELFNQGHFEKGLSLLEALSDSYPNDYRLLNNLAWLYVSLETKYKDADKSLSFAKKALMIAPSDARVWSTMSEAYFYRGEYRKSFKHAQTALSLAAAADAPKQVLQNYKKQLKRAQHAGQSLDILF